MEAAAVRTHAATFVGRRRDLDHWIDSKGAILVGKEKDLDGNLYLPLITRQNNFFLF